ncbi:MAG: type II toxin-antitoxin system death-on-curing family toxin [Planctomycetes bacterium]|nr:type II toxin-antitoxin system death-on-curing family toxin [Planctomycetota bacterium]
MNPEFLTLTEVLEIHRDQIARYGGSEGIRDRGLLESAVAMPQAAFGGQYLHTDLFQMAAAYLYHLVQNHPFIDGNKRVGAAAADVFLTLNGLTLTAPEEQYEELVMSVAQSESGKTTVADFFRGLRGHCSPLSR